MRTAEVIQTIKNEVPFAVEGRTLAHAPELDWQRTSYEGPVQFTAEGAYGGQVFIGVATQTGSRIISYGPKG